MSDLCSDSVLLMRQRGNCTLAGEKKCSFVLAFKFKGVARGGGGPGVPVTPPL